MGMDVMGKSPVSETGEYFRNNVWWWRPLWKFCNIHHPDLVGEEPFSGFLNDGYGLDADGAARLGRALLEDVADGTAERFRQERLKQIAELPYTPCPHCGASGIRTDEVGQRQGMLDRELDPETAVLTGRSHGWCNGCDGVGSQEPNEWSYQFDVNNVNEFALFLIDSGGFAIW